jgi:hypothetical protein
MERERETCLRQRRPVLSAHSREMLRWVRLLALCGGGLAVLVFLGACRKTAPAPAPAPVPLAAANSIDLEPGWRVRVVTPIQKSGSFIVNTVAGETMEKADAAGPRKLEVAVKASPDLLGFEMSYYSVNARGRDGVAVAFQSATATIDGVSTPRSGPALPLFQLPSYARKVRILHLLSKSDADHNAAILAARDPRELDRLTALVEANPSACRDYQASSCQWIPAGIAVRPERRIVGRTPDEWVPVR